MNSANAARLVFDGLCHDLHFRASTFRHNLDQNLKSLVGALGTSPGDYDHVKGSRDSIVAAWANMDFDDISNVVKEGLVREIDRQHVDNPAPVWRDKFLGVFDKVEYVLNLRLLHALALSEPPELHDLMSKALAANLGGTSLALASGRSHLSRPNGGPEVVIYQGDGPNYYHRAQNDGWFVNDHAVVGLEIKTRGKSSSAKFDAAQLAKHAWLAMNLLPDGGFGRSLNLLVLVPARGQRFDAISSDIHVDDVGNVQLAALKNKPFHSFMNSIGSDADRLHAALARIHTRVCTFEAFAELAGGLAPGSSLARSLYRVAELARPA